jgi:hypothetical protein
MQDVVDPIDRSLHCARIAYISFEQLDPPLDFGQILPLPSGKIVDYAYLVPAGKKKTYQVGTDEAGSTSN